MKVEHERLPHWKEPITAETRKPHACLHCELAGAKPLTFGPDNIIAVGFGSATLTKDRELVYEEPHVSIPDDLDGAEIEIPETEYITGAQALALAQNEPERDWIIDLQGPMSGRTYQFQGDAGFVMIDQNEGFA